MRIACVGRTAERGCLYAAVMNDKHRAAGRSGVGTVMASKNLKAVAIRGTGKVSVMCTMPRRSWQATNDGKAVLAENAVTGQGLPAYGTQVLMNVINGVGGLPARNMRDVGFEGAENISAEAMAEPRKGDGKAEPDHQRRLFRLHHRLRTHFDGRSEPLFGQGQAAVSRRFRRARIRGGLGARARIPASTISMR